MTATPEQLAEAKKMIEEALVEPGYSYIEHLGEYEGKEVFQLCYVVDEDGVVPKTGWPIYALFYPANPDRFWYKSDAGCELSRKLRAKLKPAASK